MTPQMADPNWMDTKSFECLHCAEQFGKGKAGLAAAEAHMCSGRADFTAVANAAMDQAQAAERDEGASA